MSVIWKKTYCFYLIWYYMGLKNCEVPNLTGPEKSLWWHAAQVKEKLQQHGEEGYSLFCFRTPDRFDHSQVICGCNNLDPWWPMTWSSKLFGAYSLHDCDDMYHHVSFVWGFFLQTIHSIWDVFEKQQFVLLDLGLDKPREFSYEVTVKTTTVSFYHDLHGLVGGSNGLAEYRFHISS